MKLFSPLTAMTLVFLISASAKAEIRELATFTQTSIEAEADPQAWVIFDIDNTLLRQTTMMGTHQWGDYLAAERRALGDSEADASAFQHQAFGFVQAAVPVAVSEPAVLQLIARLKSRGIKMFALTARAESLASITLKQLAGVGIDLSESTPVLDARVHGGVVFANGEPKGALLKRLIETSVAKPTKVVFADDKRYNLESLETALTQAQVPFVGFRYGFLDGEVARFRGDLANTEWVEFKKTGRVLSDEEAARLIFSLPEPKAEIARACENH